MASYTQEDLAAINEAIVNPAKAVTINGESVQYRDLADLLLIKREILADLQGGQSAASPMQFPQTSRGL
ncbi:hypothetical protein TG4357_02661 [Thalassovita gelatinovora]|uniref:Uncharacterized protein n=1 Tax=Thalassovita gelatinovora TaxID=53501 RepID=A0A0P1G4Q5_THAGE|nr:hypothetical protein [Thalassovita gelatinovora]QIZ79786.1 hypothetical protein HFZ77_04470 [Thalassovita gelatinovora]CUH66823.1 hypothetical protein TG4357_02661 [Thalassovita gelatinovora]SEQ43418.1 hypothetical protein SAMN04488043_105198 [Thalassovita gelatinovora]